MSEEDTFDALLTDLAEAAKAPVGGGTRPRTSSSTLQDVDNMLSELKPNIPADANMYATVDASYRYDQTAPQPGTPASAPGPSGVTYAHPSTSLGQYVQPNKAAEEYSLPQTNKPSVRQRLGKGSQAPPALPARRGASAPLENAAAGLDSLMADLQMFDGGAGPPPRPIGKPPASPTATNTLPKSTMPTEPPPIPEDAAPLPAIPPGTKPRKREPGHCAMCNQLILGQILTALGMEFHPAHFLCSKCNKPLGAATFFEKDGEAYCAQDYHELYSPRCGYCNEPIRDRFITAIGKKWHPDHFFCSQCGKSFDDGTGFMEKDGRAYCQQDYYAMFAPKCTKCQLPIMADNISALGQSWHPQCFVCSEPSCGAPFPQGNFFEVANKPYCATHFHAQRGSLCPKCQQPIIGKCITAVGQKFHPQCFCCHFCLKPLEEGIFQEKDQNPFCNSCFVKLYG